MIRRLSLGQRVVVVPPDPFSAFCGRRHCGFYHDFDNEFHTTFTLNGNMLLNTKKES